MVAAPSWVASIEISGEDKASAPVDILDRVLCHALDLIRRLLNAENLRKWRRSWCPFLSEESALKRLHWTWRYRHFTPEDWALVYWSDERTFQRWVGFRREWSFICPKDQPREGQYQGLPQRAKQIKQMFWAAFSGKLRRTGLIPLFGGSNSERGSVNQFVIEDLYRRLLPTLIAHEDGIFQHDNAPTHTTYIVRDALQIIGIGVLEWPPYYPDLNSIENLWALLTGRYTNYGLILFVCVITRNRRRI